MDVDGDGEMTFAELLKAFYPACSEEDIEKTIKKFTPKKKVENVVVKQLTEEQKEELEAVCRMWDKDNDGNPSASLIPIPILQLILFLNPLHKISRQAIFRWSSLGTLVKTLA